VRNHALAIVACDFLVVVTVKFQFLYVFVILELGSRRILQCNVTAHPTAEWTVQQVREAMPNERKQRFLIHDRDSIFSAEFDEELAQGFGLHGATDSAAITDCECVLRTAGRNHATRVPGFPDPAQREASPPAPQRVDRPLQFRPSPQQPGTRHP
jgi:hypothetical protein